MYHTSSSIRTNCLEIVRIPYCRTQTLNSSKKEDKQRSSNSQFQDEARCLTGQLTLAVFCTTPTRSFHGKAWAEFGRGSMDPCQKGSSGQGHEVELALRYTVPQHYLTWLYIFKLHIFTYLCNATTTLTQLQNSPILISDNFNGKENSHRTHMMICVLGHCVTRLQQLREGPSNTKSGCGWCVLKSICHKHCLHEHICAMWLGGW